jgi:magnesium transporter
VRQIAEIFQLHPLAQEDVLNTYQRAKVEPYGPHLFIVCRAFYVRGGLLETEQLSLYVGENFLLSFQETPGPDCWDPVRNRLRHGQGNLRGSGTDYLAYALLDAVIDSYFPVLEEFGERLESQEELILVRPNPATIQAIHGIKRELFLLRRAVWPLRDAVNVLLRDPVPLIAKETRIFLRDCYDHCVQIIDLVETYRELGSDLTDVYLSSVSFRTNEIMRLLTVVTSVFIPLTFLAGVWGMNFDPSTSPLNMPELRWFWGYPFALALMAVVAGVMLVFFRRRGWLGSPDRSDLEPRDPVDSSPERHAPRAWGSARDPR